MSTASGPTPPEPPEGRPPESNNHESSAPDSQDPTGAWRPEEYTPKPGATHPGTRGQGRPEGSQARSPSWNTGAPAREGVSMGFVVTLAAAGGLVLLLVIALLAYLAVRTFDLGGAGEPGPTGGAEQASESTQGTADATGQEPRGAAASNQEAATSAPATAEATSAPAPVAVKGAQEVGVPSGKPLFRKTGTLEKSTVTDEEKNAILVPAHDGPILVVWSSTGSDGGRFYVNGHEKQGGKLSASLPMVRPGTSGSALINTGGYTTSTGVLYAQGGKGAQWEVRGYALSAVPEVERGKPLTGKGTRVFRVPAGAETPYRLTVGDEEDGDYPVVEVYPADDLTLSEQYESGQAPADLDVTVGSGEKIVVVDSQQQWSFTAR